MKYRPAQRLIREYDELKAQIANHDARKLALVAEHSALVAACTETTVKHGSRANDIARGREQLVANETAAGVMIAAAKQKYEAALADIESLRLRAAEPIVAEIDARIAALAAVEKENADLVGQAERKRVEYEELPASREAAEKAIAKLEAGGLLAQARKRVDEIAEKEARKQAAVRVRDEFMAKSEATAETAKAIGVDAVITAPGVPPRARMTAASVMLLALGPRAYSRAHHKKTRDAAKGQ